MILNLDQGARSLPVLKERPLYTEIPTLGRRLCDNGVSRRKTAVTDERMSDRSALGGHANVEPSWRGFAREESFHTLASHRQG
jgi:hypothetical protein